MSQLLIGLKAACHKWAIPLTDRRLFLQRAPPKAENKPSLSPAAPYKGTHGAKRSRRKEEEVRSERRADFIYAPHILPTTLPLEPQHTSPPATCHRQGRRAPSALPPHPPLSGGGSRNSPQEPVLPRQCVDQNAPPRTQPSASPARLTHVPPRRPPPGPPPPPPSLAPITCSRGLRSGRSLGRGGPWAPASPRAATASPTSRTSSPPGCNKSA